MALLVKSMFAYEQSLKVTLAISFMVIMQHKVTNWEKVCGSSPSHLSTLRPWVNISFWITLRTVLHGGHFSHTCTFKGVDLNYSTINLSNNGYNNLRRL